MTDSRQEWVTVGDALAADEREMAKPPGELHPGSPGHLTAVHVSACCGIPEIGPGDALRCVFLVRCMYRMRSRQHANEDEVEAEGRGAWPDRQTVTGKPHTPAKIYE